MGLPATKQDKHYTYGDYRTWPDDERWELIDGVAYNMSPAPGARHQSFLSDLAYVFVSFFKGKPCRVFLAPFDVILPNGPLKDEDEADTVVQPDLSVICDRGKITPRGCAGTPDLAVEVLSPFTSAKDMTVKLNLYERHGVREYWIADPANKVIHRYVLSDGKYGDAASFVWDGKHHAEVKSVIFEGLTVNLAEVLSDLWGEG